jgi:AcrR family transcriptional regulator
LRGFDGATTSAIARAAGCSEALIFARYPTKMALFLDASRRQQAVAYRNYDEYQTSIRTTHGMGIADALALREVQRPEASLQRSTYLEKVRLSWHDEELRASLALEFDAFVADATAADPDWAPANSPSSLHMSIALGQGISLLPTLAPNIWELPYDVITIPLAEAAAPG